MKFSEFLDVRDGTHDSPKRVNIGKKLITTKNLEDNRIDFTNAKNISLNDFKRINERSKVDQFDILLSMIGTVGNVYQERSAFPDYAIKNLALLKFHGDELLSNWMNYYLQSKKGQSKIHQRLSGSTQQYISLTDLRNIEITLPNRDQMELCIKPLRYLDDLILKNNQINDNLLELISLIQNEYSRTISNKVSLKSLAQKIITGKTPSTKIQENYGYDIPFVKIPDMHDKVFIDKTGQSLSLQGANSQKNKYLPANAIMVSCIGTPGLVSLTGSVSQTNQQINSLILEDKFIYWSFLELRSLRSQIGNLGSGGTTINNLNKSDFSKLEIIIPDNDEVLDNFNHIAQPIFERIHTNNIEIRKLTQLKEALLNKLF